MASKTYESVRRKHQSISIQDKVELLKKMDHGVSVRKLCDVYSIGSSTVYDIKKQREKILKFYADCDSRKQMMMRKTMKDGKSTEHDRVMMEWFRQRRRDGVDLTGSMIMDQAKLFHEELKLQHECDYSEGWLQRFKKRHGISLSKMCREKRSVNHGAAECVDEFAKLVADEHLSPEQVYDADKTALFRRCTRRKTVSTDDVKDPTGFKQYNKLTILGCSNAADEPKVIVNLSDKDFGDGAMETNSPVTQKPCKAYSAPSQDLHESSGQNTIDGSGINNGQSVAEEVEFPLTVETPDKSPSPAEDPLQPKQIQMQHKNHFTDIMEALSCDEAFVDVTLTAEGRAIRAHKLVLSAVSPYFQQVLYDNPCRHPVIIMPYHVQFDQLTHIIEYIYKGEITIAEDQLEPLLKTAKLLQVSGLATSDSAALITESSLSTAPEMNQLPTKPNIVANHQICSSGGAVRLISTSKALVPESVSHKVSKPFYSSSVTVRSSNVSPTTPSENTSNQKKNKIANCPVVTRAVASEVVCRSAPSTFTGISDLPVTHT
ncbi:uncharacterized protein [Panulirus ornatus]|uniref:uncharacterized protein isoform X2 n=1 Tax=Panulirus ornatus TaxID=150431 RepID=UPI003A8A11B6